VSVDIRELLVAGEPPVRVRLFAPERPRSLLVWAHGGGFAGGSLDMPESHGVGLALASAGHAVVSVDYRLVRPGLAFPAPHDDVTAVLSWAVEGSSAPVFAGGASAGGNLAAGAALRLTREGHPPAGVVLAYPLLHDRVPGASVSLPDGVPPAARFPPEVLEPLVAAFAPGPWRHHPFAFVGDHPLDGFPPALVVASEHDELRPSAEAFAHALERAGGDVQLETEPGALHGHLDVPAQPAFACTIARIAAWLDARVTR
jgi:acetyl esterase/lipase